MIKRILTYVLILAIVAAGLPMTGTAAWQRQVPAQVDNFDLSATGIRAFIPLVALCAAHSNLNMYSIGIISYVLFDRAKSYVVSVDVSDANMIDRARAINNMWARIDTSEVTGQDLLEVAGYLAEIMDVEIPALPPLPVIELPELPELPDLPDFGAIIDSLYIPEDIAGWQELLDEVTRVLSFSVWR